MLINQDFSVDRTKYIGGSDIGAILGLSKYKSPLDVWLEKTGKVINTVDSLPVRFGSFAEEFVASEYVRQTGFALIHDESPIVHSQYPFIIGHVDRFVFDGNTNNRELYKRDASRLLECKTANPFNQIEWGESGSDQVPMSYLVQCLWYLAISQLEQCDLAVLFGNCDFRIYQITRDISLEKLFIEKAAIFWQDYLQSDIPPPAQNISDYQTLFARDIPNKSVEASEQTRELIGKLHQLNQEIDSKVVEVSRLKEHIMEVMGDAGELTFQGQILATWKQPKMSYRLNSKKLEKEHPELSSQYQMAIQNSRRLTIKEAKEIQTKQGDEK